MASSEDGEEDSLTKQVLNMILENNALRDTAFPYITGYITFNVIILILLIYISVRISIKWLWSSISPIITRINSRQSFRMEKPFGSGVKGTRTIRSTKTRSVWNGISRDTKRGNLGGATGNIPRDSGPGGSCGQSPPSRLLCAKHKAYSVRK